ncbi:MAG: DUF882 domain-containing protein [Burkholderiaceae bacterium]|jgi:uncharacterized protein YcbK (DUF882 family)|nr:DUF882 domain-containing protein [Burkholderiaceae bacterium]
MCLPPSPPPFATRCSRRRLLAAAGLLALPSWATANPAQPGSQRSRAEILADLLREQRSLWVVRENADRRDELRVTYWTAQRGYDREQYLQLCWLLRDVQADRVFPMDHDLLAVLCGVQAWLGREGRVAPLRIYSGYRSHSTNKQTEGAALDSRHLLGKAADIAMDGVTNVKLAGIASILGKGGTGFYPGRSFVHVDVGDERIWIGGGKGS